MRKRRRIHEKGEEKNIIARKIKILYNSERGRENSQHPAKLKFLNAN